jgi:hypothetical protein
MLISTRSEAEIFLPEATKPFLCEAGNAWSDGVGRVGLRAADGKVVLGDSQQRRRGIDKIGTAAKPASRICRGVRHAQDLEEISGVGIAVTERLDRRKHGLRHGLAAKGRKRCPGSDQCAQ